jgi:uncharacterized membrane protein YgcG
MAKKKAEFNKDVLMKYLFWACTPIGVVVAVLAGMMAIGSIATDLDTNKSALDSQRDAINQLRSSAASHPNQGTIDGIVAERDKLEENVFAAWEIVEGDQRPIIRWTGLADVAIAEIESRPFLDPQPLPSFVLTNYLGFARTEINKLLDKPYKDRNGQDMFLRRVQTYSQQPNGQLLPVAPVVLTDTNRTTGRGGSGDDRMTTSPRAVTSPRGNQQGAAPGNVVMRGKVVWEPVLDITMTDWTKQPQSFEVWLTQEDIWVYQALLWVVAESNKSVPEARKNIVASTAGATLGAMADPLDLKDSVVKRIDSVLIGTKAAVELYNYASRRISKPMSGGSEGGGSSDSSSDGGGGSVSPFSSVLGGGSAGGSSSSEYGGTTISAEDLMKATLAGRYVDAEFKPIIDEPFLSGPLRRMPVYLRFLVDQRNIAEVLVNCANCPMPIDVLGVTINPDAVRPFEFSSGSSRSAIEGGSGGISSGRTRRQDGSSGGSGRMMTGDVDFGPNAVVIEIYGCINIFAPPNKEELGGGTSK